jgi:SAM-dependent methyltransferase
MKTTINQFLFINHIRIIVGKLRFYYYARILKRLKTIDSDDAIQMTLKHNLKALSAFGLTRMNTIIKPLSVLENVSKNSRILVIGPRNEEDILNLLAHGFAKKNITGLDLISYSPLIEVGDMHNTRFESETFDVVICGWTLSYSNEPLKFANEMLRIIKDNGVIAIGVEYSTLSEENSKKIHDGYALVTDGFERINSVKDILNLFGEKVKEVYFNHNAPNKISHDYSLNPNVSSVVAIFSIDKNK